MPLKINVPYSDKDSAKSKGAFWDVEQKTWFVPDHKDINDFQHWIDKSKVSVIIKSPVSIALNSSDCYKCANKTAVISLASNNFYYYIFHLLQKNSTLQIKFTTIGNKSITTRRFITI